MRDDNKTIWGEIVSLQEQIDMLFENLYLEDYARSSNLLKERGNDVVKGNYRKPLSDVRETDNEIIAEIEMPGINKEDIQIEIGDNVLEIKAKRTQEIEEKDEDELHSFKHDFVGFYKKFLLPETAVVEKAEAEYRGSGVGNR